MKIRVLLALLAMLSLTASATAQCGTYGRSYSSYGRSYYSPSYNYSSSYAPTYEKTVLTPFFFVNGYAVATPAQAFISYGTTAVLAAPIVGYPSVAYPPVAAVPPVVATSPAAPAMSTGNAEILAAIKQLNENVLQIHQRVQKLEEQPKPPVKKGDGG